MDNKRVISWIFARGGSKGLPRKNVLPLLGRPLIAYSIITARASKYISDVYVSTDDQEIAETARKYGAQVPFMRPAELAADRAPEHLAWQHAVRYMRDSGISCDVFVSLPATAPLRSVGDVDRGIEQYLTGGADAVIAVSKTDRHPSFNMVFRDEDGGIRLALPTEKQYARRQDAPPVYNIATAMYIMSPEYILRTNSYMQGKVSSIVVSEENGLDIDSMWDFRIAEIILKERETQCRA